MLLLLLLALLPLASASHFRFGHISWVQTGERKAVLKVDQAWRYNIPSWQSSCADAQGTRDGVCDVGDSIALGYLTTGGSPSSVQIVLTLTAVDVDKNYWVGTFSSQEITYSSDGPHTASFYMCCRIYGIVNNPVELPTTAEVRFLPDRDQQSPVTSVPAIVNVQEGTDAAFALPVADGDFDLVKFTRFAVQERNPSGHTLSQLAIDPVSGIITWPTGDTPRGLYTVIVKIEDYDYRHCSAPVTACAQDTRLSDVMVDFFIQVVEQVGFCASGCSNAGTECSVGNPGSTCGSCGANVTSPCAPNLPPTILVPPTPESGSSISANQGDVVTFDIEAVDSFSFDTVTIQPSWTTAGMELTNHVQTGNRVTATFQWTVPSNFANNNQACFTAVDNHGADGPLHCVTIKVGLIQVIAVQPEETGFNERAIITVTGVNFGVAEETDRHVCLFRQSFSSAGVEANATYVSTTLVTCQAPDLTPVALTMPIVYVDLSKDSGLRFTTDNVRLELYKTCEGFPDNECNGNGECDDGQCICDENYFGANCESECPGGASAPCSGKGTCDDGADGSGECQCQTTPKAWFGPLCNEEDSYERIVRDVALNDANAVVDLDSTNERSSLACAWEDTSGPTTVQWAIGTAKGTDDLVAFSATTAQSSENSIYKVPDSTGLPLVSGTVYYCVVKTTNELGDEQVFSSDGITVDFSPPVTSGVLIDGAVEDTLWTDNIDSVEASFGVFTDNESPISSVQWCLGSERGACDAVAWTELDVDATSIYMEAPFLIVLQHDAHYYFTVRATSLGGTTTIHSNGFGVDLIDPVAIKLSAVDGDNEGADVDWSGNPFRVAANWEGFTDSGSGLKRVEWAIGSAQGQADIQAWTNLGVTTKAEREDRPITQQTNRDDEGDSSGEGNDATTAEPIIKGGEGTTYYVSIKAYDYVGHSVTIFTDGVTIDLSDPLPGFVLDGDSGQDSDTSAFDVVSATWANFTDPQGGIQMYEAGLGTSPTEANTIEFTNVGRDRSYTFDEDVKLDNGTIYYFLVRATNPAGRSVIVASDGVVVDGTRSDLPPPSNVKDSESSFLQGNSTTWIAAGAASAALIAMGVAAFMAVRSMKKKKIKQKTLADREARRKAIERKSTAIVNRSVFNIEPIGDVLETDTRDLDPADEVEGSDFI